MPAITKTWICNLALSHLGNGKEMSNVDTDVSAEASVCRLYYEASLKFILRSWRWPFATKTAALFWLRDNPTSEWLYAFMYPSDCLRLRRVQGGITRNESGDYRVPFRIVSSAQPAEATALCLLQSRGSAGALTLNGTRVGKYGNAWYTATEARKVTITAAASQVGKNFTITGVDRNGAALVEIVAGAATTMTSTGFFQEVSSVTINAATAGQLSVGLAYGLYGKEVYCDFAPTVDDSGWYDSPVVEYTKYISDTSLFDDDFAMSVSFYLAALIAPRITGGDSFNLAGRSQELFRESMSYARMSAAAEEQPDQEPESALIRSRY